MRSRSDVWKFNMTFHSKQHRTKLFFLFPMPANCNSTKKSKHNPCPRQWNKKQLRIYDKRRTRKQLNLLFCCFNFLYTTLSLFLSLSRIILRFIVDSLFILPFHSNILFTLAFLIEISIFCSLHIYILHHWHPMRLSPISIVIVVSHAVSISTWLSHHVISLFGVCCHQQN